jgi:hypothetical protein
MKTIIRGAIYSTEDGSMLLRPHFSGHFSVVDCTEYKQMQQIKDEYSPESVERFTGENAVILTCGDEVYYECEYSPICTDGMELLSDISKIEFWDGETDF